MKHYVVHNELDGYYVAADYEQLALHLDKVICECNSNESAVRIANALPFQEEAKDYLINTMDSMVDEYKQEAVELMERYEML